MFYALVLQDALTLVVVIVLTVCRDSWVDQANCHVALALLVLADSNLAWSRGGFLPATSLFREKNMHTHVTCGDRCTLLQNDASRQTT